MSTLHRPTAVRPVPARVQISFAVLATAPGVTLRVVRLELPHAVEALLFGLAIVGAAFLLSWAAEVAQLDISAGLAIAILALIAVLPEYAVDLVFAAKGGESFRLDPTCPALAGGGDESPCSLALANMTGANRLLIGVGWTMVVFIAWYRVGRRSSGSGGERWSGVRLDRQHSTELAYLSAATLYSLTLPLKGSVTMVDAAVLVAIFVLYTVRVSRAPAEEPDLVGPARWLGGIGVRRRRGAIIAMFVFSASIVLLCAEPFAESLVATGKAFGVSEFLLVQWLAPLASEAPELLVAGLYAWRLNTNSALGTLVSSKVNQWTLLVGTLPVVFAISAGGVHGLPLDAVQREELFLTAAQSFFAVAVLLNLSMSLREAGLLFVLFWIQFVLGAVVPASIHGVERIGVGVAYLLLGLWMLARNRGEIRPLLRDGFRAPYANLVERPPAEAGSHGR
jgi:cation:H+ antiporter